MPARLIVHLTDKPSLSLVAHEGRDYMVGRDPTCDLPLDDDRVSRQHARLSGSGAGWTLTDLGSKNGTAVNGTPIDLAAALAGPCWLSFGGLPGRFDLLSDRQNLEESQARLRRWQTSLELQRAIDPALGPQEVLRRVLDSVCTLSGVERGFILLAGAENELEVMVTTGVEQSELWQREFSGSIGAIERALTKGAPVVVSDAQVDTQLGQRPSVQLGHIRALVCLPLKNFDRRIGVVYADSLKPGTTFDQLDVEILEALAAHAALAIGAAHIDQDLKGLAATLANLPGLAPDLAAEIEREIQQLRQRSLLVERGDSGKAAGAKKTNTTWNQLRSFHLAGSLERP